MRVYIAGPMTGIRDPVTGHETFNYPAFHQAAAHLRALGYTVVSPAEMYPDPVGTPLAHAEYMRHSLVALLTCAAVVLLPGWERSRGARLEEAVATGCGLQVLALHEIARPVQAQGEEGRSDA